MTASDAFSVFIVAEVAQAHDGSLGILHSYIDAAAETGADAVKFQMHIADAESSSVEQFRVPFSYEDATRFDYWKRMEFTPDQWRDIKAHCDSVGIMFVASPFSVAAVRLLEDLGVGIYKIASGEITNYLMLESIARTGKPLWISSGMSSFTEIEATLAFLDRQNASKQRVLFQCTTAYPTMPEQVGLNVLTDMQQRFGYPVGLSDHSGTVYPALASVMLGSRFIECHIVFDKRMFGPDARSSLTVDEFKYMVAGVRFLERALTSPVDKNDVGQFGDLKRMFGRTLCAARPLKPDDVITGDCLEAKKPRDQGIPVESYPEILSRRLKRPVAAGQFLKWEDLV